MNKIKAPENSGAFFFEDVTEVRLPEVNEKTLLFGRVFEVRLKGVEPPRLAALDPKSSMSTSSITAAGTIFMGGKYTQDL